MHYHTQLTFVFLAESEFCHVGQAGVELLASSDLPALTCPAILAYKEQGSCEIQWILASDPIVC